MAAAAPPTRAAAADGWLWRELGATLALELADHSRQHRRQRDDHDRLHDARAAFAARARGGIGSVSISTSRCSCSASASSPPCLRSRRQRSAQAQDPAALRRATHQALLSAVFVAVVVWIALTWATPFLLAIGEPPDVARRRRRLPARVPVGPRAEPAVLCRALGVRGARAAPSGAGRGPCRGRVQCARQLRADLRQARHAGARDHRLRSRHDPVAGA